MPPESISEGALEVWNRLAPDLIDKGCLTPWDVDMFTVFCQAVATWRACNKLLGTKYLDRGGAGGVIKSPYHQIMRDCATTMAQYSGRFGLTPGDRAALKVSDEGKPGPANGPERIFE
jgi:P27 family predicted phage terminase small subunit